MSDRDQQWSRAVKLIGQLDGTAQDGVPNDYQLIDRALRTIQDLLDISGSADLVLRDVWRVTAATLKTRADAVAVTQPLDAAFLEFAAYTVHTLAERVAQQYP